MGFFDAIAVCFKKYVMFRGRAARSEFWYFFLFWFIGGIVTTILDAGVLNMASGGPLTAVFVVVMFLPSLAVEVRRLHDLNVSGWWLLVGLIPFVGALGLLVAFALKGTPGDNRFGDNPLAASAA